MFRFTLFRERSILIIKEAGARRIEIIEEVAARGGQAGAASGPARRGKSLCWRKRWGLRTGTALRDHLGADASACAANAGHV